MLFRSRSIYFHANAVHHVDMTDLEVGQEVHFKETLTEQGPKASLVRPYHKQDTAELST